MGIVVPGWCLCHCGRNRSLTICSTHTHILGFGMNTIHLWSWRQCHMLLLLLLLLLKANYFSYHCHVAWKLWRWFWTNNIPCSGHFMATISVDIFRKWINASLLLVLFSVPKQWIFYIRCGKCSYTMYHLYKHSRRWKCSKWHMQQTYRNWTKTKTGAKHTCGKPKWFWRMNNRKHYAHTICIME